MAYTPTTFVDRSVQYPGRRMSVPVSGQANVVDITRPDGIEGTVFTTGTKPDATNLNAEFTKIKNETDAINESLSNNIISLNYTSTSNLASYNSSANKYTVAKNGIVFGKSQIPPNGVLSIYVDDILVNQFINGYGNVAYNQFSFCIPVQKNSKVYYVGSGITNITIDITK